MRMQIFSNSSKELVYGVNVWNSSFIIELSWGAVLQCSKYRCSYTMPLLQVIWHRTHVCIRRRKLWLMAIVFWKNCLIEFFVEYIIATIMVIIIFSTTIGRRWWMILDCLFSVFQMHRHQLLLFLLWFNNKYWQQRLISSSIIISIILDENIIERLVPTRSHGKNDELPHISFFAGQHWNMR